MDGLLVQCGVCMWRARDAGRLCVCVCQNLCYLNRNAVVCSPVERSYYLDGLFYCCWVFIFGVFFFWFSVWLFIANMFDQRETWGMDVCKCCRYEHICSCLYFAIKTNISFRWCELKIILLEWPDILQLTRNNETFESLRHNARLIV